MLHFITHKQSASSTLKSEWGEITYGEWCRKEADRMNSKGGSVRFWESAYGTCAVIHN